MTGLFIFSMRIYYGMENFSGVIALHELFHSPQTICQLLEKTSFFMKFSAISIPIKTIQVKDFICPKYTDVDNNYLLEVGDTFLSNPILVDTSYQLIACECRLRVNTLLGRNTVLVHKVNLSEVVRGKLSIKIFLKYFLLAKKPLSDWL